MVGAELQKHVCVLCINLTAHAEQLLNVMLLLLTQAQSNAGAETPTSGPMVKGTLSL